MDNEQIKRLLKEKQEMDTLKNVISTLSNSVNNLCFNYEAASTTMADQFRGIHRTLQQSTMELIARFIKKVSEVSNGFIDVRNEAAIKWTREVAKIEHHFPLV